jgi:hypothetical protein
VTVPLLLVALIIGFLLGTRARQLAASLKMVGKAMTSLTIKIPAAASGPSIGADEDVDKEDLDDKPPDLVDYLNTTPTGMDDNPDLTLNPILMYQIKKAKEEAREAKRIAALANEGLTEDEIAERILAGVDVGGDAAGVRQNALAVLVNAGARVLPVASGDGAENQLIQERRRLLRTVDVHLSKNLGIDTAKARLKQGVKRVKDAYDVARETSLQPVGGETALRSKANIRIAKEARNIFREWLRLHPLPPLQNDDDEDEDQDKKDFRARGGMGALDATQLAALALEFAEEEGGEEGDREPLDA